MSNNNGTTTEEKKVKLALCISDQDPESFRKKLEKFREGKTIIQEEYGFTGFPIGVSKIPGMDTSMMQASIQLLMCCYIVIECTEAEKFALTSKIGA